MVAGAGNTSRALGRIETALTASGEHWPMNMVAVLRLAPAPHEEPLRSALGEMQRRHPALRARIVKRGRRYAYSYDGVPPVPLDVVEPADTDAWIGAATEALNSQLPAATGPLARSILLRAGDGATADLVMAIHHSIVDAVSGANLLDEVLATYGALVEGRSPPADAPLGAPAAADALFPPGYQGLRLMARRAGFTLRQMGSEMRYRMAMRRAGAPPVRPHAKTQVHSDRLDGGVVTALGRAARQRRLTLPSALQAALLSAVHRHRYQAHPLPLRTLAFTDLRPYLTPPVPAEQLACYVALASHDVDMDTGRDLWDVARDVQAGVVASLSGGAKFVASSMTQPLMRMAVRAKRFRLSNAALSHTGVARLGGDYGPLEIRDLHAFISNLALGPEVSLRTGIFDGRLTLDAMTLDTDMDRDEMRTITEDVAATLEELAGS